MINLAEFNNIKIEGTIVTCYESDQYLIQKISDTDCWALYCKESKKVVNFGTSAIEALSNFGCCKVDSPKSKPKRKKKDNKEDEA